MQIVAQISAPMGARANEDRVVATPRCAGVFDGATALDPAVKAGVQVCVDTLAALFVECADALGDDPAALIERATAALQAVFGDENDAARMAVSTMAYVHEGATQVTVAQVGDSPVLLRMADGSLQFLPGDPAALANDAGNIAKIAAVRARHPDVSIEELRALMAEDLRLTRRRLNTPEGHGMLAARPGAAAKAVVGRFARGQVREALVMTDGFSAICETFGLCTWAQAMDRARAGQMAAMVAELRAAQGADALGLRYPRFKQGDDASAVLLAFE